MDLPTMQDTAIETLTLDQARERRWDVLVAGSSFAAMFFARGLPAGLSVLLVERGEWLPLADRLAGAKPQGMHVAQTNHSEREKVWIAQYGFGGGSNCWWGQAPRFHPDDFALASRFGVGRDWPISYDTLEPHYAEAEQVMEIAGGGDDHIFPRSRPRPFPPHAGTRAEGRLRAFSDMWVPAPSGRSNGGSRTRCCANGVCNMCPVDAKFTIMNGLDRFARPRFGLLLDSEVRAARIEAGRATGLHLRMRDGREAEITGDLVAIGANAIQNAAILHRSGLTGEAVGRYLHEQDAVTALVDLPLANYYGGSSITGLNYAFYHGADRGPRAGVLVELMNAPVALRPTKGRWTERLQLKLIGEDMPRADNRVVLGADDEARVLWQGHDPYLYDGTEWAKERLQDILPVPVEAVRFGDYGPTEAHIQGGHVMGADPATSVVDPNLRCHEVANLLALGAGAFPTCSPANPSLTIAALSLHAGRAL